MHEVSVVMPVYNTPKEYLSEAVNSILNQTFDDFEFIIIDDCSNEETRMFLESIDDSRVIVKRNPTNYGITKSLNIGFEIASGKYIARMDSDDISLPNRIEKQVEYMESNPDVIVCGCGIKFFSNSTEKIEKNRDYIVKIDDMELFRIKLLFCNCGPAHPTVMYNKQLINKYSVTYNEYYENSQDYYMWVTCSSVARMHIIGEVLLYYREHDLQISTKGFSKQQYYAQRVRKAQLERLFVKVDEDMLIIHEKSINGELSPRSTIKWLRRLLSANNKNKVYDKKIFSRYIDDMIYQQQFMNYCRKKEKMPNVIAFVLFAPNRYKRNCFASRLNKSVK